VSGITVWRCETCARRSFPRRELCPFCAGRVFSAEPVDRGTATEVTSHRGVAVACVSVDDDLRVVARAEGEVRAGSEVGLRDDGGAPVAVSRRAALPGER
jgi:uncharacterized OB-fold protein